LGANAAARRRRQHQGRIRGSAGQVHRVRDLATHADDVDDCAATATDHALQHCIHGMNVAEEFRVHGIVPGRDVEIGGGIAPRGAGGVDENVDRAGVRLGGCGHALGVSSAREIGGDRERRMRAPRPARERGV